MSRLSENQVLLLQPTNEDSSDETEDKSTTTLATLTSTCIPPEKDARLIIIKDVSTVMIIIMVDVTVLEEIYSQESLLYA